MVRCTVQLIFIYGQPLRWKVVLSNILLIFNLVPGVSPGMVQAGWTIGVEVLFYAAFPLLAALSLSRSRALIGTGVAVLAAAAFFLLTEQKIKLQPALWGKYFDYSIVNAMPVFLPGIVTYAIHQRWSRVRPPSNKTLLFLIPLGLIIFVSICYSGVLRRHMAVELTAVSWSLLILGSVWRANILIVNPVTKFLGRISYSMYLDHPVILLGLLPLYFKIYDRLPGGLLPFAACVAISFPCVVSAAFLTYQFIEQPCIRFGSRLLKKMG